MNATSPRAAAPRRAVLVHAPGEAVEGVLQGIPRGDDSAVEVFEDLDAAFAAVSAGPLPDVLLVSAQIPEPGMAAWIRRVRAAAVTAGVPILAVNLPHDEETVREAYRAGANSFTFATTHHQEMRLRINGIIDAARTLSPLAGAQVEVDVLLELTNELAQNTEIEPVLHTIVKRLAEVTPFERASIMLLEQDRRFGRVMAASESAEFLPVRIPLDNYPELREVIRTRTPLEIPNVQDAEILRELRDSLEGRGVRSMALLPLEHAATIIGILFLRSANLGTTLGTKSGMLTKVVASATALALRNARLFKSLREEASALDTRAREAEVRVEALAQFEEFFEHVAVGMAVADPEGRISYLNREGMRITGCSRDIAIGMPFKDLADGGEPEGIFGPTGRIRPTASADLHIRHRSGHTVVINLSARPWVSRPGAAIISFRDVTRERSIAAELENTKDFLERLIQSSADAIIAAGRDGTMLLFNRAAERLLGYKAEDVLGKQFVEQLYRPGVAREIMTLMRDPNFFEPGRIHRLKREVLTASGEGIPVEITGSIIYDGDREVASVGILSDLRERLNIENRLDVIQRKLAVTERQVIAAELAGAAAHELNQPLTVIMGYVEILRKQKIAQEPQVGRALDNIFTESKRIADIVRKIGRITKYETKSYPGETRIVDLARAAGEEELE